MSAAGTRGQGASRGQPRAWRVALAALAALAALVGLVAPGAARGEERFALLVGANAGWANDRPLRYAEADAERLRDALVELGGFAADRVELLRDPDTATVRARLQRLAATLQRAGRRDSLVLFYYSGHADERNLHLRGAPLSYAELRKALEALPATVRLGVLDACRSGSILAAKGAPGAGAFQVEVVDTLRAQGLALLTSSGADELSQETRALAGSVFTHHLVSGLRGAADVDGDGRVVLSEAWRHAYVRTSADTAPTAVPQQPGWLRALEGQGEPVLAWLEPASSRLVLPRGSGERYVLADAYEVRLVAEALAGPEGPVVLALAPGRYRLKRVRPAQLEEAEVVLAPRTSLEAQRLAWASRPLAGGLLKGRPEGPEAVHAWRRGEALRLLAADEPGAALSLFESLLAEQPEDEGSRRGKARALVRLAEAYDRVGEREKRREALREALKADPGLVEDPDLRVLRGELRVLGATLRGRVPEVVAEEPRAGLRPRWGVGVEPFGPRGALAVVGSVLLAERWKWHASVDLAGPGLGVGVRLLWETGEWSGFIGAGGHLSLRTLGGPAGRDFPLVALGQPLTYQQLWGANLHGELGLHYLSPLGLYGELSLGALAFAHGPSASRGVVPMLGLAVGWLLPAP